MSQIALSAGTRANLLSLQGTAQLLSRTQERLSTGLKVNSPLDDASAFFTSRSLNNRANDLSGLMDGMSNAQQTIRAAAKGLDSMSKIVDNMLGVVRQAQQATDVDPTRSNVAVTLVRNDTPENIDTTVSFAVGATTVTATLDADTDTTASTQAARLNTALNNANISNVRFEESNGSLVLVNSSDVEVSALQVVTATPSDGTAGAFAFADNTQTTAAAATNNGRLNLMNTFNELRRELDQLSRDSGFNGKNLLNGDDITVIFNELTGSSRTDLTVQLRDVNNGAFGAVNNDTLGIGSEAETADTFTTDSRLETLLGSLQGARTDIRQLASQLGTAETIIQNRQDFTKALTNVLRTGADNLTLADMNEEAANSLALQTKQQLGQSALALATRNDQAILQLLR